MSTLRQKIKPILSALILIVCFSYILVKCLEENTNQEETFTLLKAKFNLSVLRSGSAENVHYDPRNAQKSFLMGCKVKYIILKGREKLTGLERLIEFDNDSINRITVRKTTYRKKINANEDEINWYNIKKDSVYVLDFKKRRKEIYRKSKLVKTVDMKSDDENENYIYAVKSQTEEKYNCN